MKVVLIIIIFFPVLCLAKNSCKHDSRNFRCVEYVKNYDADTITFNIPGLHQFFGEKINVRLSGVDAPEIRSKNLCEKEKARNAKKLVANLLKRAKKIDLESVERGKHFRIVADVILDGKSLSSYLLKNKLAYSYNGGKRQKVDWCNTQRFTASEGGSK